MTAPSTSFSVIDRAILYLRRCRPAVSGQGGHNTTFRVACALVHGFGLGADQALSALRGWNRQCLPPWSDSELRHKILSAMAASPRHPRGYLVGGQGTGPVRCPATQTASFSAAAKPAKPAFVAETLRRVADRLGVVADGSYFKDRSPVYPETQTPASFLHRLYLPGEKVIVFDVFKSQGRHLCEFDGVLPYDAGLLDHLVHGCKDGVWFLCNPVDGQFHPNPRKGGELSRRSRESVTSWRFLLLESDKAEPLPWLGFLAQVPLRIAAVYTSAGKSIHALVRINAASKADWDAKVSKLKPALAVLGADEQTMTGVQLTRLPGCYRGEEGPPAPKGMPVRKRLVDEPLEFDELGDPIWTPAPQSPLVSPWTGGKLQELLYLDPNPSGQPICQRPARKPIQQELLAAIPALSEKELLCN